jgi:RNA polymerase sigma factor (sigma-70 family)
MADQQDARARWAAEVSDAFRTHGPQLHRSLLSRLRNEQDARDAAQEVFLRLTRVSDTELVENPVKYLFGIAHHVVSEVLERRRRDPVEFNSNLIDHHAEHPPAVPPDRVSDGVETQQALKRALERLRPIEREILVLIKQEGMTHEEVAIALGLSRHTVKKYVVRSLAQLKLDWVSLQLGGKEL